MTNGEGLESWVERVSALKQYQHNGKRMPQSRCWC